MKYLISKIRIPSSSIEDIVRGIKFNDDFKQEYNKRVFDDDIVFDFSMSIYITDGIIDVYNVSCDAIRTANEHIAVELPSNIEFESRLQVMYNEQVLEDIRV